MVGPNKRSPTASCYDQMVAQKSQKEIYEVSSDTIKETECACSSLIRHASRARLAGSERRSGNPVATREHYDETNRSLQSGPGAHLVE